MKLSKDDAEKILSRQNVKRLMARMLEMCGEELSRNGCNDFDLSEFLEEDEQLEFVEAANVANGSPEEFDPENLEMPDWWIAAFLAQLLEKMTESIDPPREEKKPDGTMVFAAPAYIGEISERARKYIEVETKLRPLLQSLRAGEQRQIMRQGPALYNLPIDTAIRVTVQELFPEEVES